MSGKDIVYRKENSLVPCASKHLCRVPFLGDGDHKCSHCKNPIHIVCLGKNNEGGGKKCAICVSPNGLCVFAKGMPIPQAPAWFNKPQRGTTKIGEMSNAIKSTMDITKDSSKKEKSSNGKKRNAETISKYNPHDGKYILVSPSNLKKATIWNHFLCFDTAEHQNFADQ